MLLSRTVYSLIRGMYLAGCELQIQTLTFLIVLTLKTVCQRQNHLRKYSSKHLSPASHDLRGLDPSSLLKFFRESELFQNRVYILTLVCSLRSTFYPQFVFCTRSATTSPTYFAVRSLRKRRAISRPFVKSNEAETHCKQVHDDQLLIKENVEHTSCQNFITNKKIGIGRYVCVSNFTFIYISIIFFQSHSLHISANLKSRC